MSDVQYQTAMALYGQGRHAEGVHLLGQAARDGHVPAMTLLGHQMLTGRGVPMDSISGARLIVGAAERGGGMACTTAAALLAAGAGGRPDWPRALDYLRRGAEFSFPAAQAQLRLLAGRDGDDWKALRRAIDVKALRQAPKPRTLSKEPRVQTFDGLASGAVCDWIIAQARDRLRPAKVYDTSGALAVSNGRNNSYAELSLADSDLVVLAVRERLAAAAGLQVLHMDGPPGAALRARPEFRAPRRLLRPGHPQPGQPDGGRGQRIATVLLYLNDEGLEGGETDFPRLGFAHRGKKGDALVFFNVDASGQPDPRTLHAGLAPTQGEKWVVSQWIRDRGPPGAGDPRLLAALNGR
ncbi:MAG: 2OG-Fe(II) oxygenase [Caulobacteraceae bacterium]